MSIITVSESGNASTSVSTPALKKVIVKTNLVLYGSGFLEPNHTGVGSHNAGDNFKKVAEARQAINEKNNPYQINKIYYCPTDYDFFKIINDSKNIIRLDIYCHGWLHGINLGGFKGKRLIKGLEIDGDKLDWNNKNENQGKDLRRVEIHEDLYLNSTEKTELLKLKKDMFDSNVEVYFWGCNIGGQLSPSGKHIAQNKSIKHNIPLMEDPKQSFAQKFAEHISKGNVYALVGKGVAAGSVFKTDLNKKVIYFDGEMLPANIAANKKYTNTVTLKAINYMKKFPL